MPMPSRPRLKKGAVARAKTIPLVASRLGRQTMAAGQSTSKLAEQPHGNSGNVRYGESGLASARLQNRR